MQEQDKTKVKRSNNLCSTYILPLTGLNPASFGVGNFINAYLNEDNVHLAVELQQTPTSLLNHPCYRFGLQLHNRNLAVLEIPKELRNDLLLFREGKYSKFSDNSKDLIRRKSGLRYRVMINGVMNTARELLALEKHEELRKVLEKELDVKISKDAELASIPGDENFIQLQLSTELAR